MHVLLRAAPVLLIAVSLSACDCGPPRTTSARGELAPSPASVDFGTTAPGLPLRRAVDLVNRGSGPATVTELVLSGDDASLFTAVGDVPAHLGPGERLPVALEYRPSVEGPHAGRLLVHSDATSTPEVVVFLTGRALNADPCAGVVCDAAPGPCYRDAGVCTGGACTYPLREAGAACDDGDDCTVADACGVSGACVGAPRSCTTPPPRVCVDAQVQRSWDAAGTCGDGGTCRYVARDERCALGCDSVLGGCRTGCPAGQHPCSGACVSDTSVSSCGASCAPCPVPANGAATCTAGACGVSCSPGYSVCGASCCAAAGAATALAVGMAHACVLTLDGGVSCWGANDNGQLGDGTTANRSTPALVPGLSGLAQVSAGAGHTAAVTRGGAVLTWGGNWSGQLGDGSYNARPTPGAVVGLDGGVVQLSAGAPDGVHTCVLSAAQAVSCWGGNGSGQLGHGTVALGTTPTPVAGLDGGASAVSAGQAHTCALVPGGGVRCWGDNSWGQVGDGTTIERQTPVGVVGLSSGVLAVAAGGTHTCAVLADGGVACWGSNAAGQLGAAGGDRSTPVGVAGLGAAARALSLGNSHTCALLATGAVWCWGWNQDGELGTPGGSRSTPAAVPTLSSVSAVGAGRYFTCALTSAGRVSCWGGNQWGELGDGSTVTSRSSPGPVAGF